MRFFLLFLFEKKKMRMVRVNEMIFSSEFDHKDQTKNGKLNKIV